MAVLGFNFPPDSGEKVFGQRLYQGVYNCQLISYSSFPGYFGDYSSYVSDLLHEHGVIKKSTKVSNLTKLSQVSDMQPPSSETPLIGTYFSCIMIMVGIHVLLDERHRFF